MTHRCFDEKELVLIGGLPADDVRRREAARCPRCDSLLSALSSFLLDDGDLPKEEMERADRRLSAFIGERLQRSAHHNDTGGARGAISRSRERRRSRALPRWRLGAAVGVAAVLFVLIARIPSAPTVPSGAVRGGAAPSASKVVGIAAVYVGAVSPGSLHLSWASFVGAEQYQVEVFTAALDLLGVIGPVTEPAAVIDAALLESAGADGALCRVLALNGGVVVGSSQLSALPRK